MKTNNVVLRRDIRFAVGLDKAGVGRIWCDGVGSRSMVVLLVNCWNATGVDWVSFSDRDIGNICDLIKSASNIFPDEGFYIWFDKFSVSPIVDLHHKLTARYCFKDSVVVSTLDELYCASLGVVDYKWRGQRLYKVGADYILEDGGIYFFVSSVSDVVRHVDYGVFKVV